MERERRHRLLGSLAAWPERLYARVCRTNARSVSLVSLAVKVGRGCTGLQRQSERLLIVRGVVYG